MKLLYCSNCGDVFAIHKQERVCLCGKTKGHYVDNLNAVYSGSGAVPLGFHNASFTKSLLQRPQEGMGKEFIAFVIPHVSPSFKEEIKETTGSEAIVSCKDRNNPNFQIWGAMSDLKCRKKKTFKEYLKNRQMRMVAPDTVDVQKL